MSNSILLVFEGESTEIKLWQSLNNFFINETPKKIITSAYSGEIYQLYNIIKDDTDIDTVKLIKERLKNKELDLISRDNVSEIYLFFDYDGHSSNANDDALEKMLLLFNNETELGKLYVSYPMIESIRHLSDDVQFSSTTVPCKENIKYKKIVHGNSNKALQQTNKLSLENWSYIIHQHCCKLNFLINREFTFPTSTYPQEKILLAQITKHISTKQEVSVLNALPIFILDYYGCLPLKKILEQKTDAPSQ